MSFYKEITNIVIWKEKICEKTNQRFNENLTVIGSGYGYIKFADIKCKTDNILVDTNYFTYNGNISLYLINNDMCQNITSQYSIPQFNLTNPIHTNTTTNMTNDKICYLIVNHNYFLSTQIQFDITTSYYCCYNYTNIYNYISNNIFSKLYKLHYYLIENILDYINIFFSNIYNITIAVWHIILIFIIMILMIIPLSICSDIFNKYCKYNYMVKQNDEFILYKKV